MLPKNRSSATPFARKTLIMRWTTTHEHRVMMDSHPSAVSQAIADAMFQSGLSSRIPGVDPESIRFEVEDEE